MSAAMDKDRSAPASASEAKARLAASREAIYRYLAGDAEVDDGVDESGDADGGIEDDAPMDDDGDVTDAPAARQAASIRRRETRRTRTADAGRGGALDIAQTLLAAWWHDHPARTGMVMADAALAGYARRKPWQLLMIAAGVGAGVVLVKPWRLVSTSALALGLLRSSNVQAIANSLVMTAATSLRGQPSSRRRPRERGDEV